MGKHSAKKYTKKGKIIITIIISIILCCIILGVIMFVKMQSEQKNDMEEKTKDVINNLFTALKETNEEEVNKYLEYKALIASLDEMLVNYDSNKTIDIEKGLFNDIEWNIESIEVNENKAVAIVEVTNKNFINVIKEWMNKVIDEKENGETITNEVALEKLKEVLEEEKEDKKTVIKKIILYKEDNDWKVELNDDFIDLVFPGIDSINEALL
jgi:hypothetical protein